MVLERGQVLPPPVRVCAFLIPSVSLDAREETVIFSIFSIILLDNGPIACEELKLCFPMALHDVSRDIRY